MRLYERFTDKGYHTCIATTFGIDFDAYESIVLSRLQGSGCRNNMVIADGRMLTHALNGASELPRRAGTHYTVSGAATAGLFHPKLILQLGRRGGRLIVGSANMTPSGLAGNLELVDTLTSDEAGSGAQQLIVQAWEFVSGFIDGDRQSLANQRSWTQARTPWLGSAEPATGLVPLADGTLAALLISGQAEGLGERFAAMIDETVHRLVVISPYWDRDLTALSHLATRLGAMETAVLVDPDTREFPSDAIGAVPDLRLYDRGNFQAGRYIHAKAMIAQTDAADHLLVGSANCTHAALGVAGFAGSNREACLYRRLPPGGVMEALDLASILAEENIVRPDVLDPPVYMDDLPLDELQRQGAGQFECQGDILRWHPPAKEHPADCSITLLDDRALPLACTLKAIAARSGNTLRYEMSGTERQPAFARVTFPDGKTSSPAIVTQIDKLRMEIRETRRSGSQRKIDELEGDPDARLALLELIDELEAVERDQATPKEPISLARDRKKDEADSDPSHFRTLSYEEFVAGRRPRMVGGEAAYNSLAGSDVAIVRSILNRIIGLGGAAEDHDDDNYQHHDVFNLGDETDDAESALAAGYDFGAQIVTPEEKESGDEKRQRRVKRRRDTQTELVKAVERFRAGVNNRQAAEHALTNFDLIRLRVLLMILSTAASPQPLSKIANGKERASLRVLPVEGEQNTWPVLMGRLLFSMFGGNNPAIRQLQLTNEHDQMPDDFNECWGTCYWCFQACLQAPFSKAEGERISKFVKPLIRKTFLFTLPSQAELISDQIMGVFDRMSNRYAKELRLDPAAIEAGHRNLVQEVFSDHPDRS